MNSQISVSVAWLKKNAHIQDGMCCLGTAKPPTIIHLVGRFNPNTIMPFEECTTCCVEDFCNVSSTLICIFWDKNLLKNLEKVMKSSMIYGNIYGQLFYNTRKQAMELSVLHVSPISCFDEGTHHILNVIHTNLLMGEAHKKMKQEKEMPFSPKFTPWKIAHVVPPPCPLVEAVVVSDYVQPSVNEVTQMDLDGMLAIEKEQTIQHEGAVEDEEKLPHPEEAEDDMPMLLATNEVQQRRKMEEELMDVV